MLTMCADRLQPTTTTDSHQLTHWSCSARSIHSPAHNQLPTQGPRDHHHRRPHQQQLGRLHGDTTTTTTTACTAAPTVTAGSAPVRGIVGARVGQRFGRSRAAQLEQIRCHQQVVAEHHLLCIVAVVQVVDGHLTPDDNVIHLRILGRGLEELLENLAIRLDVQRGHCV